MNKDIVVSVKTIFLTLLMLVGFYGLYRLGPILLLVLVAGLLVVVLEPVVKYFMKQHFMNKLIPRGIAVTLTYLLFVSIVLFILTVGVPPVFSQTRKLIENLSNLLTGIPGFEDIGNIRDQILPQISDMSGKNILEIIVSLFSNLFAVFTVIFVSLYISLDWQNIKKHFYSFFSGAKRDEVEEIVTEVEETVGHWVKGELLLMVVVGTASFIGLAAFGIDYALALGLVAGLFEVIPNIGPTLSAILASIVGFSEAPVKGFLAIGLFILIQELENNILVPKIMGKVTGFSPIVVILALLVGAEFMGFVGAIIAIPLTMIISVVVKRLLHH